MYVISIQYVITTEVTGKAAITTNRHRTLCGFGVDEEIEASAEMSQSVCIPRGVQSVVILGPAIDGLSASKLVALQFPEITETMETIVLALIFQRSHSDQLYL